MSRAVNYSDISNNRANFIRFLGIAQQRVGAESSAAGTKDPRGDAANEEEGARPARNGVAGARTADTFESDTESYARTEETKGTV